MTVRIRLWVHVSHPQDIGRPRWEEGLRGERELHLTMADGHLVLAEAAATCLSNMLAAITAGQDERDSGGGGG